MRTPINSSSSSSSYSSSSPLTTDKLVTLRRLPMRVLAAVADASMRVF